MVLTDVKVEGSDLPVGGTTSSSSLVLVQHGTVTTHPTSNTKRANALSTFLVIEDRREVGGHDDDEKMWKYR